MQDLESEVRSLIAEIIERDPGEITEDAKFSSDLGVDSIMALEIMAAMEKKYKITIPEEKLVQLNTLRETLNVIKEYIGKKEV